MLGLVIGITFVIYVIVGFAASTIVSKNANKKGFDFGYELGKAEGEEAATTSMLKEVDAAYRRGKQSADSKTDKATLVFQKVVPAYEWARLSDREQAQRMQDAKEKLLYKIKEQMRVISDYDVPACNQVVQAGVTLHSMTWKEDESVPPINRFTAN